MDIKKRRQARKISQESLAGLVGVSVRTIWKWENKGILPSTKYLPKLTSALKCSTDDLIGKEPA